MAYFSRMWWVCLRRFRHTERRSSCGITSFPTQPVPAQNSHGASPVESHLEHLICGSDPASSSLQDSQGDDPFVHMKHFSFAYADTIKDNADFPITLSASVRRCCIPKPLADVFNSSYALHMLSIRRVWAAAARDSTAPATAAGSCYIFAGASFAPSGCPLLIDDTAFTNLPQNGIYKSLNRSYCQ